MDREIKIALIGNPNTGKSTFFNNITGLSQQTGNYPGVTVEKKVGFFSYNGQKYKVYDLPGLYSIHANSLDESIVLKILLNKKSEDYPDIVVYIADCENIKRNLLLYSQIKDLGFNTIVCINMSDLMDKRGISLNIENLEKRLSTDICLISSKTREGYNYFKSVLSRGVSNILTKPFFEISNYSEKLSQKITKIYPNENPIKLWYLISQDKKFSDLQKYKLKPLEEDIKEHIIKHIIQKETIKRYSIINSILSENYKKDKPVSQLRKSLDAVFMNPILSLLSFLIVLFFLFQLVFNISAFPMDMVDILFSSIGNAITGFIPQGPINSFVVEGILPGISGVLIFIPQITLLFLFMAFLEDTGYISRIVFTTDKIMKPFGLSGRSLIPFVSGTACAIPAILSARSIENRRERLIITLSTPFINCSAKLPVLIILISLLVPNETQVYGFFNLQALIMMAFYVLSFSLTLLTAFIINKILKRSYENHIIMEMPDYKLPIFKSLLLKVYNNVKAFVLGAGKIIFSVTIIIWFLGSYGFNTAQNASSYHINYTSEIKDSFLGSIGKGIEPIIKPLGYDWKIGIALITSFLAREIFVSTLYIIYSIEENEGDEGLLYKLKNEVIEGTENKVFSVPTTMSLLIFYTFAMQCVSTFAVIRKELNSFKIPVIQLLSMNLLAYIFSFLVYQLLK